MEATMSGQKQTFALQKVMSALLIERARHWNLTEFGGAPEEILRG
jgi:hypothetical protein